MGDMSKHMGARVLEPAAEYPGFGHPQNPRVSSQTRTHHGYCPTGLHLPGTRVSITLGTPTEGPHFLSI